MIKDLNLNLSMHQLAELLQSVGDKVNLNIVLRPSNVETARFKMGKLPVDDTDYTSDEFRDSFTDEYTGLLEVQQRDGCKVRLPDTISDSVDEAPKKRRRRKMGRYTRITKKHLELRDTMDIAHHTGRLCVPKMRKVSISNCDLFDKKTKNFLQSLGYTNLSDVTKSTEALILSACNSLKFSDYITKTGLGRVIECLEKIGVFLRK